MEDSVYTTDKNGVSYKITTEYYTVVDRYGPGGEVDLSHHEPYGYSTISEYKGQTTSLDFTFAKPEDVINLKLGEEIQSVTLNFSNLKNATFESQNPVAFEVVLDCGMRECVEAINEFLQYNSEIVSNLSFRGIESSILMKLLEKRCKKFEKNVSFRTAEKRSSNQDNIEEEIDEKLEEIMAQLIERTEKLEEIKKQIEEGTVENPKEKENEVDKNDTEEIKKQLEELKRQITKKLKKQFKYLSIEDIMAKYDGKFETLIEMIDSIESEKKSLKSQLAIVAKGKILDTINSEIDESINSSGIITDEIADFWTIANNVNDPRVGIVRITRTESGGTDRKSDVLDINEKCFSFLEFELSKRFGKPIPASELKRYVITDDYSHIRTESEFIDETSEELSLQQKNDINMKKEKIRRLQEKVKKHPKRYNKPGTISLYRIERNEKGNVKKSTEFEIEITQAELISLGLDPADFDWRESEKAKVDSSEIAKASKSKRVKKSGLNLISGFFLGRDARDAR